MIETGGLWSFLHPTTHIAERKSKNSLKIVFISNVFILMVLVALVCEPCSAMPQAQLCVKIRTSFCPALKYNDELMV